MEIKKLLKSKAGIVMQTTNKFINGAVFLFLAASLIPIILYAVGNVAAVPNIPLASFFASSGVVPLLVVVFVIVSVIAIFRIKGMK